MFTKSRFGGSHIEAAKPNVSPSDSSSSIDLQCSCDAFPRAMPHCVRKLLLPGLSTLQDPSPVQPPSLWSDTLPPEDHKWIATTLFRVEAKGKLELRDNLQLWYYPPQPALLYHQTPTPDRFFSHCLLLWMPYKLWKIKTVLQQLDLAHRSELRAILMQKYACDISHSTAV
ncbi:hypothetical protein SKAU_G00389050 [Synaphobranchus kaupii]|uniref:DUF6729 domain-containing protein n=1 Tax=Synaphobranchus kaupii TaxID=118154 RepID=A0A9Q1IBF0_SYNKA|nr:hypothetical protein SKAU_G00389050 [Synaphobranchus kaupii]